MKHCGCVVTISIADDLHNRDHHFESTFDEETIPYHKHLG
eukprot:SAG25_NODE_13706_length_264_cov_0.581818_1_plen_39_part_10